LENLSNALCNNAGGQPPECMLSALDEYGIGLSAQEQETKREFRDWNCKEWRTDKMPKRGQDGTADECVAQYERLNPVVCRNPNADRA